MNPFDHASASYSVGGSITRLEPSASTGDDQSKTEEESYVIHTAVLRQAAMDVTSLTEADATIALKVRSLGSEPSFDRWKEFVSAAKWLFAEPQGSDAPSEAATHLSYATICESLGVSLETARERVFSYLGPKAGGLLCSISGPGYARFVNPGKAKQIPQKAPSRQKAPALAPSIAPRPQSGVPLAAEMMVGAPLTKRKLTSLFNKKIANRLNAAREAGLKAYRSGAVDSIHAEKMKYEIAIAREIFMQNGDTTWPDWAEAQGFSAPVREKEAA